jgi:DNA mismatch repair protein MutS2
MITRSTIESLEFNKLLGIIADFTKSDASRKAVLGISPLDSIENINKRQSLINEIRLMSQKGNPLNIPPFPDIKPFLQKLRPEDSILEPIELSGIMIFLSTSHSILNQIRENSELPLLSSLTGSMTGYPDILKILKRSIDTEGNILDSASPLLKELRTRIRGLENRIRKKLEALMRDERVSIFLQNDFITQRSGRWVIPVRMDSKGQVPGIVHDVSRSGETAFIEPIAIIGLANELENLIAEQKTEEIRILKNICSRIRTVASEIIAEYEIVVYIDMLNSIAILSDMLKMQMPEINNQNAIYLDSARHPLLMLALQKKEMSQQVIPLDVRLGGENIVMVITGPNAGGKTIAIKTIGILLLMALSGMPVSADSSSSFPLISNLLIDIGDQQSIESNLSTFSAHVSNISEILKNADSKTIALIDELGTGTDPDEGSALACAVLKDIKSKGAMVFATTHLAEIKGFVHKTEGMLNASMAFDSKTFMPLYKLRVGEPGQSHAFETARRFGLPENIIDAAKHILGFQKIEIDSLIHDLNERRRQYETAMDEIRQKKAEIAEKERLLKQMVKEAENRQKEFLSNAYKEASIIILNTKRQMHAFLEDLKKTDREGAKEVIREVESAQVSVAEKLKEYEMPEKSAPAIDEIAEGDVVFVKSIERNASVVAVNRRDNRMKVRAGSIEIEVPLSDIYFKKDLPSETEKGGIQIAQIESSGETVSSVINIIGLRVDEALSKIEPFLNHTSLAGFSEVTIIHGIGTGALSKAVRDYLKVHPLIKSFRSGSKQEGGAGVTIAALE